MLLPPIDAAQFLQSYKALLERVAETDLKGVDEYRKARTRLYEEGAWKEPPTEDAELSAAALGARYGQFVVGRHLARYTEVILQEDRVFRVVGISNELREIIPAWTMVQTAVMEWCGRWICDGLYGGYGVTIGPNMRRGYLEKLKADRLGARGPGKAAAPPTARTPGFTEKQGQYLAFIFLYTKLHRQSPAEADLQRYFRVAPPTVHQMVVTLERQGLIWRMPGVGRPITLLVEGKRLPELQ